MLSSETPRRSRGRQTNAVLDALHLHALRRLAQKNWSSVEIAAALTDLSFDAILQLEREGWTRERVERLRRPGAAGRTWGKYAVHYWRRQFGLAPHRQPRKLLARRQTRWRCFQVAAGWLHLLPANDEARRGVAHGGKWAAGHELTPRQIRVLTTLRDAGPQTRRQLAAALGYQTPEAVDTALWELRRGGLVSYDPKARTNALTSAAGASFADPPPFMRECSCQ